MNSDRISVRFLDPQELDAGGKEAFLKELLQGGTRGMAENAIAEARALLVGSTVLPLLVVNPAKGNCDLCSPMAHHVHYARDEVLLRSPRLLRGLVRAAYAVFGRVLELGRIDKAVSINNWLYTFSVGPGTFFILQR